MIPPDFYHTPAGGIRAGIPLPSAEIDASGKIYLTWPDSLRAQLLSQRRGVQYHNDGVQWTPVTRIPANSVSSGVDHFIFGLGVDRSTSGSGGHLALTYYYYYYYYYYYPTANCTSATCALDVGITTSADGGATWTANFQLAGPMSLNLLPNTSQGRMVGDYISTSFSSGGLGFPAFAVAFAPTTEAFNEAIYTVAGGVAVSGASAAIDHNMVSSNAQSTSSSVTAQYFGFCAGGGPPPSLSSRLQCCLLVLDLSSIQPSICASKRCRAGPLR